MFHYYIIMTFYSEKSPVIDNQCRKEFKKITEGDLNNIGKWENLTNNSIKAIEWQLSALNIKATYNIGESFYE